MNDGLKYRDKQQRYTHAKNNFEQHGSVTNIKVLSKLDEPITSPMFNKNLPYKIYTIVEVTWYMNYKFNKKFQILLIIEW